MNLVRHSLSSSRHATCTNSGIFLIMIQTFSLRTTATCVCACVCAGALREAWKEEEDESLFSNATLLFSIQPQIMDVGSLKHTTYTSVLSYGCFSSLQLLSSAPRAFLIVQPLILAAHRLSLSHEFANIE